jgi:DNA modification methylase
LAYTKQIPLFKLEEGIPIDDQEWGTFKDSLRAPVHNWFTYPAGFSYKAVEASLRLHHVTEGMVVYDPFMGSGTTNLTAKTLGVSSFGVEAHPFVFRIAETKLNWAVDLEKVSEAVSRIQSAVKGQRKNSRNLHQQLEAKFPELILKCYEDKTLADLLFVRDAITQGNFSAEVVDFLFVGLTSILRQVSTAATGWPYIAPKKQKTTSLNKDALSEFARQTAKMINDIETVRAEASENYQKSFHKIFNADSRDTRKFIPNKSADHVFTSPPYLNNFDYADRTRLELYFFGEAKTWGDISETVRTKLITSATTQISRDDPRYNLTEDLARDCPEVFQFLGKAVSKLGKIRLTKGGKKSYDHLVSGYFNDMYLIVSDVFRVLKSGKKAVFVLGDSAPYGIHIPTDELIGKIGVGIGFADYKVDVLRTRGGKWKDNPQRHDVALRESIVTLTK